MHFNCQREKSTSPKLELKFKLSLEYNRVYFIVRCARNITSSCLCLAMCCGKRTYWSCSATGSSELLLYIINNIVQRAVFNLID